MNDSYTLSIKRLSVLLLIATIAQYLLYLLGLAVRAADKQWQYQANTVRHSHVLSNQYLGLRAYRDKHLRLKRKEWLAAINTLKSFFVNPQAC